MKNTNASLSKANYVYELKKGTLYFFDDYLISQIHNNKSINKYDLIEVINLINKHYGSNKPYGLINFNVNSYDINPMDVLSLMDEFGYCIANVVVTKSNLALRSYELEKRLLKFKGTSFENLIDAKEWILKQVNKAKKYSKN